MNDGTGLAEALLGLSGFRFLEVTGTDADVVIDIETEADLAGCAECGVRAEAQVNKRSSAAPTWWASSPTRLACSGWPGPPSSRSTPWQIAERRYLSEGSMAKLYASDKDGVDDKEVGTDTKELLAV